MELSFDMCLLNRFFGAVAKAAANSGYRAFSKWPPAAILNFFKTHITGNYSLNLKCNISKLAILGAKQFNFQVIFGKKSKLHPRGAKIV